MEGMNPPRGCRSAFSEATDPSVIAAAARGCERSAAEIHDRYAPAAWALANRMLDDPETARDCVQDALIRAFTSLDQFRGDAPFGFWLRRIVLHAALGRMRRDAAAPITIALCDDVLETAAEPDGSHALALSARELRLAVSRLPQLTRAVLWLHVVEGMTHLAIGHELGRTASFSKSQVARGLSRLRELLEVHDEYV